MKSIYFFLFILMLFIGSCKTSNMPYDSVPNHDSLKIESKILGETRTINIWVPEDYTQNTNSLPVLYMPDGGVKEDFPHVANTLSELIKSKKIPPYILVGIENIQRRKDLSGFTTVEKDKEIAPEIGGSEKFRTFINNELFPEIERKYRTTEKKGIIGESLVGLFVVETLLQTPEMFDYYIAFDPSLWWNNQYQVKNAKENLGKITSKNPVKFWFASSATVDIQPAAKELFSILKSENNPNIKWEFSDEPNEQHGTIYRATKEKAIIWTLGTN